MATNADMTAAVIASAKKGTERNSQGRDANSICHTCCHWQNHPNFYVVITFFPLQRTANPEFTENLGDGEGMEGEDKLCDVDFQVQKSQVSTKWSH